MTSWLWGRGVIRDRLSDDSPDQSIGPDPNHGTGSCESVKIQTDQAPNRTTARYSIMHWMKHMRRRLHRHVRSLSVIMAMLLAIASLQTAWGCTAPAAMKMAQCCIGSSCPEHHAVSCAQQRDTAIPSMISTDQHVQPLWMALPSQPAVRVVVPASAQELQTNLERRAVASGPPIQLRFCTFLK